jgi:hypothetical protein
LIPEVTGWTCEWWCAGSEKARMETRGEIRNGSNYGG